MTPAEILADVREALELAVASKGASSSVRVYSRRALAKLDSLEMVEGRAWRMDGESRFTVTNLYPPDTRGALLLTVADKADSR